MLRYLWVSGAALSAGRTGLVPHLSLTTSLYSRYQISRDEAGEVNIDVVVGDTIPAPPR